MIDSKYEKLNVRITGTERGFRYTKTIMGCSIYDIEDVLDFVRNDYYTESDKWKNVEEIQIGCTKPFEHFESEVINLKLDPFWKTGEFGEEFDEYWENRRCLGVVSCDTIIV